MTIPPLDTLLVTGSRPVSVLLVESNPADARLIQKTLADARDIIFRVECAEQLSAALERLGRTGVEVVLLDLVLPGGAGIDVFDQIQQTAPKALILILCNVNNEQLAHQTVLRGAYDYFVKDRDDARLLLRTLRDAIARMAVEAALRTSESRFRAISDASPLGIFVSDTQGSCIYTNAAYHQISGLTFDETLGTSWSKAIHPEDRQRVLVEWLDAAQSLTSFQTEFRFLREDGSVVWTRVNGAVMQDTAGPHGHVQTIEDISARKSADAILRAAEEALFEQKERAQVTLNSIGDAVLTTDLTGNVTYMNQVAEAMTNWSCEDALGRPLSEVFKIVDGTTGMVAEDPTQRAIGEDRKVSLVSNCMLLRRGGGESAIEDSAAPIHNRNGQVTGAVIVFHDVSDSRAMAQKMAHLAQHDFLTDLPNRALLTERLSLAIGLARRHHKQVALLFVDLDFFKNINDSLGHAIGDQLLQSVASRLTACVRATDTVCRQGGDEFVILLAEIEQPYDAAQVAEKLLGALSTQHVIGGHELHISLSIGISIYPDDGIDAETLMQNADTAMYHAKTSGRNNYQFFRAAMNIRAVRRQHVENGLRRALKQHEFLLHYQPKIDLASNTMVGAEALIRWQDPEFGLVYPASFVPIAEECGLMIPMGRWVLHEVCRQVRFWLDSGLRAVPVAVNISAMEFRHRNFLQGVALILKQTGLSPEYLELELTESILMHDAESSVSVLEALSTMGVQLAIDDFGTGYSNFGYLKRFPIDTLKIDQSFMRDIATDADDATIVGAMIDMGRSLKQRVIAEGVETQEQVAFLRNRQCDGGQGFRFSRPLSVESFALLLDPERETVLPLLQR